MKPNRNFDAVLIITLLILTALAAVNLVFHVVVMSPIVFK